jgi:hypothetical protein
MTQPLTFDAESHTYRYAGAIIPSVTQILEAEGISDFSMVPSEALRIAQERGTAVHQATEYLDQDRLDWESVDPSLLGYLEAWERFKDDCEVTILEIETRVYSELGYAGTLDRIVELGARKVLIDIKSGAPTRAAKIQTAAYQFAHPDRDRIDYRAAVQLSADGKYKLHPYHGDLIWDFSVFSAALTLYQFKRTS